MELPKRKPTRLKGYDYSLPGAYFITICTKDRKCILSNIVGEGFHALPQNIIGQLKSYTTKKYGHQLWQRSFHDHIIRDSCDYDKIWEYIDTNVLKWELDCFYNEN